MKIKKLLSNYKFVAWLSGFAFVFNALVLIFGITFHRLDGWDIAFISLIMFDVIATQVIDCSRKQGTQTAKCAYCSFDDYSEDDNWAFGKDLIYAVVGLEKRLHTGEVVLATYEPESIRVNYCPICGRKLGE